MHVETDGLSSGLIFRLDMVNASAAPRVARDAAYSAILGPHESIRKEKRL